MYNFVSDVLLFLPVDIVLEAVMRGIRDNAAKADREWEEALSHSGIPNGRLQEFRPFRSDKVQDPVDRTVQSNRAKQ